MLLKLIEKISSLNKISKKIIIYGSFFSYLLIIAGFVCINLLENQILLGQNLLKTGSLTIGEIIIGSLFLDILLQNMV